MLWKQWDPETGESTMIAESEVVHQWGRDFVRDTKEYMHEHEVNRAFLEVPGRVVLIAIRTA